MLLGLLSDTHDNVPSTLAAIEALRNENVAAYLHAGDLVAPEMLDHFAGLPLHFVFGNNEYDHAAIKSRALSLNLHCHAQFADLEFAGKRIALLHGHETALMARALSSGKFDYLIHGHTHLRRDERIAKTRVINPGALQRARIKTVAVLDVTTDLLKFIEIVPS